MDREQIRARQMEIVDQLQAILSRAEGRDLSEAEAAEFDRLDQESRDNEAKLRGHNSEAEERAARRSRAEQSRAQWGSTNTGAPQADSFDLNLTRADDRTVLDHARRLVGEQRNEATAHLGPEQRARVEKLLRTSNESTNGADLARSVIATSRPEYRSAFMKFVAGRQDEMTDPERRAVSEVRALSIGTGSAGGYAVPVSIDPTIIMTAQGSSNPIARLARVETITTDKWKGLSSAGMSWKWDAEAAPSDDDSPTLAQPEIDTHRADGFIPYSIEVEMDWPSFVESMVELFEEGYNELLASALTVGTGANTPTGLIPALVAAGGATVRQVATSATLAPADIYGLWGSLPERARNRNTTAWMSSVSVENSIRQFGTTDPNFTENITVEGVSRLFGKEYAKNDFMAVMPAAGNTNPLLVAGDFKKYIVAQRMGMTVERIQMLFDPATNRPTGQRGMVAYARVGAGVVDAGAFRLLVNKV